MRSNLRKQAISKNIHRNNIHIEGIAEELGETWESMEAKVKEVFVHKPSPAIKHAHQTGKDKKADGTPKPRTVVL